MPGGFVRMGDGHPPTVPDKEPDPPKPIKDRWRIDPVPVPSNYGNRNPTKKPGE